MVCPNDTSHVLTPVIRTHAHRDAWTHVIAVRVALEVVEQTHQLAVYRH